MTRSMNRNGTGDNDKDDGMAWETTTKRMGWIRAGHNSKEDEMEWAEMPE